MIASSGVFSGNGTFPSSSGTHDCRSWSLGDKFTTSGRLFSSACRTPCNDILFTLYFFMVYQTIIFVNVKLAESYGTIHTFVIPFEVSDPRRVTYVLRQLGWLCQRYGWILRRAHGQAERTNRLGLPVSNGDAAKFTCVSRAGSYCCIFAMSRKLKSISLQHNCIPLVVVVTRYAERALTTRDWERRFRVAKSQPHRAVLHYRQGRLQQACTSHLTCK